MATLVRGFRDAARLEDARCTTTGTAAFLAGAIGLVAAIVVAGVALVRLYGQMLLLDWAYLAHGASGVLVLTVPSVVAPILLEVWIEQRHRVAERRPWIRWLLALACWTPLAVAVLIALPGAR